MRYLLQIFLYVVLFNRLYGQEKHFVFMQTDNRQPFYVSLNGKIYSSTTSGYVIIPKLSDGEYNVTVGFPANAYPEHGFKYVIDKKDLGFNLKNFGEKGWGLFNLQTLAVIMPHEQRVSDVAKVDIENPKEEYKPEISFERKKDPPVTKTETKIQEKTAENNSSADSAQVKVSVAETLPANTTTIPDAQKETNSELTKPASQQTSAKGGRRAANSGPANRSVVKKVDELKGSMGVYQTYIDSSHSGKDTVQVIIPGNANKQGSSNEGIASTKKSANNKIEAAGSTGDDLKFLNMEVNKANSNTPTDSNKSAVTTESANPPLNSQCKNLATEQDFTRLRKKMAISTSDEKMINEARKAFKNKCFTTKQIKGLSTLFLSDEGRYKFFDASYNYAADAELYSSLEKEFIDVSFVNRFKSILRK